jgi:hypothetical protein
VTVGVTVCVIEILVLWVLCERSVTVTVFRPASTTYGPP